MPEQLYAKWEEIRLAVREAVEGDLTDYDESEGPPSRSQIEWAEETATRVVQATMMRLDGYDALDVLREAVAPSGKRAPDGI